jgi:hypothetical protein
VGTQLGRRSQADRRCSKRRSLRRKRRMRHADGQGAVWKGKGLPHLLYAGGSLLASSQSPSGFADQSVECVSTVEGLPSAWRGGALRWTTWSTEQAAGSSTGFSRRTVSASSSNPFIHHSERSGKKRRERKALLLNQSGKKVLAVSRCARDGSGVKPCSYLSPFL